MDSAVLAEDSSSASVNLQLTIQKTEWASAGILKVYPEEGPSFLVRVDYLSAACLTFLEYHPPVALPEDEAAELLGSARIFLAERAALSYLARAEQCRFNLSVKLSKKGYSGAEVSRALDYLESAGYLDDLRFAEAWLRNRSIHQSEGRRKLLAGLMSRGISMKTASCALDSYFMVANESLLCEKAISKLIKTGKSGDTLRGALARKGFSGRTIAECMKKR
jgi:regulatory protein